jgi:hypothetical protein
VIILQKEKKDLNDMTKYLTELESIIIRCTIVLTMSLGHFTQNLPTQKCELCYEIKV